MSLLPHIVYTLNCSDCAVPYRFLSEDGIVEEALFPEREVPPYWARQLAQDGWVVGRRHLCPPCAVAEGDALVELLATMSAGPADSPVTRDAD
ncbi:hypothetical protein ACFWAR_00985 [Streptomyces sp. NPDC059917]|uniref:hypothetical protein n=1 Tax=Streptomyces sp. NPDC059917 TaxID=3347002 RepID=UPI0036684E39